MHVVSVPPKKPVVNRRSHPKVKSGCVTCKVRRVKCDERRPFCLRCEKFGIHCDGYAPPKRSAKRLEFVHQKAILLPKTTSTSTQTRPLLPQEPSLSRFENAAESRYFEVFSTNTAYEIFPNVEMGKLRTIFLQACEARDSIKHALIALGALDMTAQAVSHQPASQHYQFAIKEYARAIKYAQTDGGKDFRAALITSLVILSFEGWVGNHEVAVQQVRIGTRLLKEWKERYQQKSSTGIALPPPSEDENVLSHVFTRLSIQLRAPPPPPPLKDKLPASAVPTPLPPLKITVPSSLTRMPKVFNNLAEAGDYYGAIVRFAVTFVYQGVPRIARASSLTGAYNAGATGGIIPPEIIEAQASLTKSLDSWMAAFTPLKTGHKFKSLDERKAAITLELQMKATYMGTVKSLAQDELVFDAYYEIYKDIVDLSELLLECSPSSSRAPKFCFDSAIIIPLWFTGHKCRDPILRRRAISLLLRYPRREGVWDSVFAGLVIDSLREFEEEYMENGKVPGWARIRATNFDIDMKRRIVEIQCQQRTSGTSDVVITRRKTVDYYVHTGITLEQVGAVIAR